MTILEQIVETKRQKLAAATPPLAVLEEQLVGQAPTCGFIAALREAKPMHVIAEVKKASPSAGVIRADFDPVEIAKAYADNGATCISVLTDEQYFEGHLDYLRAVSATVTAPTLRKDFILDRRQLLEARLAGASAVLLIAEILPGNRLNELLNEATALGLDVLLELHDAEQLPRVIDSGASLIGINNRNLRTFETRLEHTLELMETIPSDRIVVSESGIRTHADLLRLGNAGVKAVLVGESLMRSADIGLALRELLYGN